MREPVSMRVSASVVVPWALLLAVLVWFLLRTDPAAVDPPTAPQPPAQVEDEPPLVAAPPSPLPASGPTPPATPPAAPRLEGAAPQSKPPPDLEGRVTFDVRTEDGRVPERVLIKVWAQGEDAARVGGRWWDTSPPTEQVPPGRHHARAFVDPEQSLASEAVAFEMPSSGPGPNVTLVVRERRGLRGRILMPETLREPPRLDLSLLRTAGSGPATWEVLRSQGQRLRVDTRVDPPTYQAYDLEPGWYVLGVMCGGLRIEVQETVEVRAGVKLVDLTFPPFDAARFLAVRVLSSDGSLLKDSEGEPLRRMDFRVSFSSANASMGGGGMAVQRADGSWWVERDPFEHDVGPGRWTLTVQSAEHGQRATLFDPTKDQALDLRFDAVATLDLELVGYAESPLAGRLTVVLKPLPEDTRHGYGGGSKVPASGKLALGSAQPGAYVLLLVASGTGVVARLPVQVAPGEQVARLTLPAVHVLTVRPRLAAPQLRLGLTHLDPEGDWVVCYHVPEPDGTLRFENLPAGRYRLFGKAGTEKRELDIQVPQDLDVVWE